MEESRPLNRRKTLVLLGTGLTGVLIGCSTRNKGVGSTVDDADDAEQSSSAGSTSDEGSATGDAGGNGTGTNSGATADTAGNTSGDASGGSSRNTDDGEGGVEDCVVTDSDIEGPYYISDAPIRSNLDLYGDAGIVLMLSGRVLDADCNPIPNAVVEIWHADPTTTPVGELTRADSVNYDNTSAEMRYRGQTATDAEGRYEFRTKKPGWYLNGSRFRPMHIHVKVWSDGTERLTTQLYFAGDPYISGDPWASADRSVGLASDGAGVESGSFDFALA